MESAREFDKLPSGIYGIRACPSEIIRPAGASGGSSSYHQNVPVFMSSSSFRLNLEPLTTGETNVLRGAMDVPPPTILLEKTDMDMDNDNDNMVPEGKMEE